jgi:hypothetical protein
MWPAAQLSNSKLITRPLDVRAQSVALAGADVLTILL